MTDKPTPGSAATDARLKHDMCGRPNPRLWPPARMTPRWYVTSAFLAALLLTAAWVIPVVLLNV